MERRQEEKCDQIIIRCFPRHFDSFMLNCFVDELRVQVGPVRYFRVIEDHFNKRLDTVGFLGFYNSRDNIKCLTSRYPRIVNPQDSTHFLQFRNNKEKKECDFDEFPHTEVKIVKWLRDGREVVRTWTHRDENYERYECTSEVSTEPQNKKESESTQKQVLQQRETSSTTKIKWIVFNKTGTDTEDNGLDVEEQKS